MLTALDCIIVFIAIVLLTGYIYMKCVSECVRLAGISFLKVWLFCGGGFGGVGGGATAAIFSCTISCSIIVPWITSIAGDNRQAAERTGRYRTPTPVWEAVWIISCLPCRLSMGAGGPVSGGEAGEGVGLSQCWEWVWLYGTAAAFPRRWVAVPLGTTSVVSVSCTESFSSVILCSLWL